MNTPPTITYSPAQRAFALGTGLLVHSLFAVAVALMAFGLYTGLQAGRGTLTGWPALMANGLLILQFPLLHSWLLSDRGRKLLKRITPLGLGGPLATTLFAGVSSLQLLVLFAGWSPLHSTLWTPPRPLHLLLTLLYAISWGLLLQAMREAGLRLQTGSLGWRSVWKGHPPAYPPLPLQRPLHRVVRHPIYIAFALILWTSPAFTLEKIILAFAWTLYCIAGSRIKEQRLLRFHGPAYRDYLSRVPFWVPAWPKKQTAPEAPSCDAEVLVVGGGPVGLLLANLLGQAGRSVLLVEAGSGEIARSMAIGITPPSLDVLAGLDLDRAFIQRGVRIDRATVHENQLQAFALQFGPLPDDYPFILSLPQADTVALLRERLAAWPNVHVQTHARVTGIANEGHTVTATLQREGDAAPVTVRTRLAAACDGARSPVGEWLGVRKSIHTYAPGFIMADFNDRSDLGDEAHLFFGRERPVESFPLPGGRRRWIVRESWRGITDLQEPIAAAITRLTGMTLDVNDQLDGSRFRPYRKLARRYDHGRVALCGDAAHVMSPIGGQGMNTGFGDAAFLARAFDAILDGRGSCRARLRTYSRQRRRAFRIAAARAALGMALGVAHGPLASALRASVIALLFRFRASRRWIARWFTMRSLPAWQHQLENAGLTLTRKATP